MDLLKQKILKEGRVIGDGVLKVDGFLNHQIDVDLVYKMGEDIYEHFKDKNVTKILTIEASGIGLACMAALFFKCKVLYAKKSATTNLGNSDLYTSHAFSFTHQTQNTVLISKKYLEKGENVLIIDDFLAHGEATNALMDLVKQAGANLVGVSVAIEKGFQGGGDKIRERGIDLYSLAVIDKMNEQEGITFRNI